MTRLIASREGAPPDELPSQVAAPFRERSGLPRAENVQASIALFSGLVDSGPDGLSRQQTYHCLP